MMCVSRDPHDILISFADWIGERADFYMQAHYEHLSRESRVVFLLHGGTTSAGPLLPISEILARDVGWLRSPGLLQVSFTDLIGDAGGHCDALSTSTMAELHAHVATLKPLECIDTVAIYGGSVTFNKGRSQRGRKSESVDLVDEIAEVLSPHLATWGYAE